MTSLFAPAHLIVFAGLAVLFIRLPNHTILKVLAVLIIIAIYAAGCRTSSTTGRPHIVYHRSLFGHGSYSLEGDCGGPCPKLPADYVPADKCGGLSSIDRQFMNMGRKGALPEMNLYDYFQFLNDANQHFANAISASWGPTILLYGLRILFMLAIFETGLLGINAVLHRDLSRIVDDLARVLLSIGVVFFIFSHAQEWGQDIINGFIQLGGATSGMSPLSLTPTGIMQTGFNLAAIFWRAAASAGWFTAPASAVELTFCSIVMVISFACAALTFLEVLIEAAALVVGGSILVAFASVRWTWSFLPGWASAVMATGVRLMFMLMILAVGLVLANQWSQSMAGNSGSITTNTFLAIEAMVESLCFALLAWRIPRKMAGYVDGKISAALGEGFLQPALQGAGSAVAAGGTRAIGAAGTATNATATGISNLGRTVDTYLLA